MFEAIRQLPLVNVDRNSTGVGAVWNPGENAHPCQVSFSSGDGILARALAATIMSQPAEPAAFCPFGDGRNVSLYFSFPRSKSVELVQKALNGCGEISAPGRGARSGFSEEMRQLLAPIAPKEYKRDLA